jgi:hypothetical protein
LAAEAHSVNELQINITVKKEFSSVSPLHLETLLLEQWHVLFNPAGQQVSDPQRDQQWGTNLSKVDDNGGHARPGDCLVYVAGNDCNWNY